MHREQGAVTVSGRGERPGVNFVETEQPMGWEPDRKRSRAPRALALLLTLVAGCTDARLVGAEGLGAAGSAEARFAISSALGAAVDEVVVTVSKGDGPDFPSFDVLLSNTGTSWSGFTAGVPAGSGRQFDVVARDASGSPIFAASAKTDVTPSGTTYVAMLMQPATAPPAYAIGAPILDLLTASSTLVSPGGAVRLNASAHGSEASGAVSYRWSASCQRDPTCQSAGSCGSFDSTSAPAVAWMAPASPDTCQLSLTVQDDGLASVTVMLAVDVSPTAPPSVVAM